MDGPDHLTVPTWQQIGLPEATAPVVRHRAAPRRRRHARPRPMAASTRRALRTAWQALAGTATVMGAVLVPPVTEAIGHVAAAVYPGASGEALAALVAAVGTLIAALAAAVAKIQNRNETQ